MNKSIMDLERDIKSSLCPPGQHFGQFILDPALAVDSRAAVSVFFSAHGPALCWYAAIRTRARNMLCAGNSHDAATKNKGYK